MIEKKNKKKTNAKINKKLIKKKVDVECGWEDIDSIPSFYLLPGAKQHTHIYLW